MKAIFNSRIIDTSKPLFSSSNRAFCYGDGLFETIVTADSRIDLIGAHLGRLKRGCDVLGVNFPKELTENFIRESILSLKEENNLQGNTRTKIQIWREEGGLYSPESNSVNYLIECKQSLKSFYRSINNAGISEHYKTHHSPISFAKTMNALNYVLAGKEMKDKGFDEIILTDGQNNLSETHIANLFWAKGNKLFTPHLSTGCIEGVMRNAVIKASQSIGIEVEETEEPASTLMKADSAFATNASGITWFKHVNEKQFSDPEELIQPILKRLLQP